MGALLWGGGAHLESDCVGMLLCARASLDVMGEHGLHRSY